MCHILVHLSNEVNVMPDITDEEKSEIREIAGRYANSLWKVLFNEGLVLYVKSNNELYIHPARWKYCLRCGEINKKEKMENHKCLLDVEEFPIVIQTSWFKLKNFFLSERYKEIMKDAGIDKISSITVITESRAEEKDLKEIRLPASEKESI